MNRFESFIINLYGIPWTNEACQRYRHLFRAVHYGPCFDLGDEADGCYPYKKESTFHVRAKAYRDFALRVRTNLGNGYYARQYEYNYNELPF